MNPILKYIGYIIFFRFVLESVKSFINFEKNLIETLPLETSTALRKCNKQKEIDEINSENIESKDCSSNIFDDDSGVSGIASLHPIIARHSIRQSLVHGIFMICTGIGVVMSWRLNEWLSTNSNDSVESENDSIPESKTVDENDDSGDDTISNINVGEAVSETDDEINVSGEGIAINAKGSNIVNVSNVDVDEKKKVVSNTSDKINKYSFFRIPTLTPVLKS